MNDAVAWLVGFGRALRDAGVPAGPARVRTFCEAAAALAPADLYWAGRASLLWRPEHIAIYDDTFRRYFGAETPADPGEDEAVAAVGAKAQVRAVESGEESASGTATGTASRADLLQHKSFARCTEADWAELALLFSRLPEALPRRRSRRYEPGRPGDLPVRRVLRRAATTGGEPFKLRERRRRLRVRPLIFVLDVSGSMTDYARGLLLFAHAAARMSPDTDVYTFGTRLTRLTEALSAPSFDVALGAGESLVPDWDGGTRIGEALASLLATRGRRADTRRAIAIICSDGLDTGEPEFLGAQMERLQRAVHRVVWMNPLKEDPRYEPLARGMQAALPHVDILESGHNADSLLALLRRLSRGAGRPGVSLSAPGR
jgi:uncharacterized protein